MKNIPMLLFALISISSCKTAKELPTVPVVDINRYLGTWYEIARFPHRFEKTLECVTATYTFKENGKIKVVNIGRLITDNNQIKSVTGSAWVPDAMFPGQLKVQFFWPFAGDYYIIALDKEYNFALVGDPSRKYLWVLSKNKMLDEKTYNELLEIAKTNGFDISKLGRVKQECN